jgi:hypothetical protein
MKIRRGATKDDAALDERLPDAANAPVHGGRLLGDLLVERGSVTAEEIAAALAKQHESGGRIGEILLEQGVIDERTLTAVVGEQSGLKVVDLRRFTPEPDALERLDGDSARSLRVLPLRITSSGIIVALDDVPSADVLQKLTKYLGRNFGILLAPHLTIHMATDPQEPGLAGNWRGSFGHKNVAAAIMAMLLFLGIYFISAGGWIAGVAVICLSSLFLLYSAGKSSLTLCFAVLLLTSLTAVVRSFWLRAVMLLTPLVLLNMLSVGTTMSDTLAEIAKLLPLDASFTGRIDIWNFAMQSLQSRLATGYGFASFWGSSAIQNLPEGKEWAAYAAHSHNGYLDTALGMGLPGLALLIAAIDLLAHGHAYLIELCS